MRILCIGDSLGMPRPGVSYEDTWFYKLSKAFPQHVFVSEYRRAMLINEAVDLFDSYYVYYKPDVVIIQTGICDCSPRTINTNSSQGRILMKICKLLHITKLFWKIVKQRDRKASRVYTKLEEFGSLYETLINKFLSVGVKKIIVVKFGHGSPAVLTKSKFFNQNVDLYNNALDDMCVRFPDTVLVANPLDIVTEDMFIDGYHCNGKGMSQVYSLLCQILGNIVMCDKD